MSDLEGGNAPPEQHPAQYNPASQLPSSFVLNFLQDNEAVIPLAYEFTEVRNLATSPAFSPFTYDPTQLRRFTTAFAVELSKPKHYPGEKPEMYMYNDAMPEEKRNAEVLNDVFGFTVKCTSSNTAPITALMDELVVLCDKKQGRPLTVNLALGDDYISNIPARLQPYSNLKLNLYVDTPDQNPPPSYTVSEIRTFTPLTPVFGLPDRPNPRKPLAHIRRIKRVVVIEHLGRLKKNLPKSRHHNYHIGSICTTPTHAADWAILLTILSLGCKCLQIQSQEVTPTTLHHVLSEVPDTLIDAGWLMYCAGKDGWGHLGFHGADFEWTSVTDITDFEKLWTLLPAHIQAGDFRDLGC